MTDTNKLNVVEATGYSETFSFADAFKDAIRNLPPDPNAFPDKLTFIKVESIGAESGGIVGINRLIVKVSTVY